MVISSSVVRLPAPPGYLYSVFAHPSLPFNQPSQPSFFYHITSFHGCPQRTHQGRYLWIIVHFVLSFSQVIRVLLCADLVHGDPPTHTVVVAQGFETSDRVILALSKLN